MSVGRQNLNHISDHNHANHMGVSNTEQKVFNGILISLLLFDFQNNFQLKASHNDIANLSFLHWTLLRHVIKLEV